MARSVKPLLTKKQKQKRLEWANTYKDFSIDDWKCVLFKDESMIRLFSNNHNKRVWGKSNLCKSKYSLNSVKCPTSLMVWGCMSYHNVGKLVCISGTMNSLKYIDLLEEYLDTSLELCNIERRRLLFQQDNAPCHTAKRSKEFFKENGINLMSWPPNSPDLNPIENLWYILKERVAKKNPKNAVQLESSIKEEWEKLSHSDICKKLILSMEKRVKEVLLKKGANIDY